MKFKNLTINQVAIFWKNGTVFIAIKIPSVAYKVAEANKGEI